MEQKESTRRSSSKGGRKSSSSSSSSRGFSSKERSGGDRKKAVKEAVVASVIVNERSKYESKIRESQTRLTKFTNENDRLLDEVSNLRLQIREMKNDRGELVRAHHESMSLLAQVSEEKLVEFKSKSEQEAVESKAAQEEALRTVLEMMEKDCEDRVAELDSELARIEEERERAQRLQREAAANAEAELNNKTGVEEAAKLAVSKLVQERASRDVEVQNLEEREKQLKHELELTKQQAEMDKRAAQAAHAAAEAASAVGLAAAMGQVQNSNASSDGSRSFDNDSYSSYSGDERVSSSTGHSSHSSFSSHSGQSSRTPSDMSPLIRGKRGEMEEDDRDSPVEEPEPEPRRPPVVNRRTIQRHSESPFLNDPKYEMTRGRKIAMKLQKIPWYQPRGGKHWDVQGLGLQSAWAYFEHSILPRYIVRNADGSMPTRPTLPGDDRSKRRSRVPVYESDAGSTDTGDDAVSNGESDVDDWLVSSKPQKPPKNNGGGKGQGCFSKGDLDRAEPGEANLPTKLYSPLFTPLSQLGDFGIGVGLYFSSLRAVAFITLIAGCINLPNMMYFASEEYSKGQPGVSIFLRGSAICTEQFWVPCPSCTVEQFEVARSRIAGTTTITPDGELQTLVFALKNACDGATFQVGIINMASLGFILLAITLLSLFQRRKQIAFDEQEQTAQDYSIEIYNPPGDATEPEEWKEFFESRFGGHLTCCTVTIDNDLLVRALAERREVLFRIEEHLKEGSGLNTLSLSEHAGNVEHNRHFLSRLKSRLSPDIPELVWRLSVLNARIQGLAQLEYRATRVFCTFETEGAQRHILSQMTVGSIAAMRNNTHKVNPNLLFRGELVLHVREAEEPSTIRWMDLDEKTRTKLKQVTVTTFISLVFILAVAVIVAILRQKGAAYAALAISISNALFPTVAKALTNLEAHATETGKQSSLFVKIAIFRWVVTAIVITIITPFTSTITNGNEHLLKTIYVIFFADLVTTNVSQLLDPVGNFKRHFLAPRARSQERMNLLMGGTEYTIAERYTNMTKTLFLTFYYCAIFPSAFFFCAVTLSINFIVDKFSLMRTWRQAPMLGPYIAKFSRIYFMTTAIAALALVSSYLFSGFPFDNLCAENISHTAYYGSWAITDGEGQESTAVIEPRDRSYHFCNQFLGPGSNFAFPALPEAQPSGSTWMTDEQEQLTGIYGWVSVGVLGLVGLVFMYELLGSIKGLFSASYKPDGDVQGESFSQVETISSYIPQVNSASFTHPLLAVNIDHVEESIFDWTDPERSHSYYDLTRDAEQLLKGNEDACQRAFAQIRHWPPGGVDAEEGEKATKSALRKSKDTNAKRNNVSWSSKVTCKTYSKDDPNNNIDLFNANASTSEGMNFSGHSDPIYDPHAQNEANIPTYAPTGAAENPPNEAPNFDPYAPNNANFQNNSHDQQPQQDQTLPDQHFDQYYGTGLDYANQPPDPMYGDSQTQDVNQGDDASWEGSEGSGSYDKSGSSTTSGSYSNSVSSGSESYSHSGGSSRSDDSPSSSNVEQHQNPNSYGHPDGSSRSDDNRSSFNEEQHQNPNNRAEFIDDDDRSGSGTYDESVGTSRGSSNNSANNHADQDEFYEEDVYEDGRNWDGDDGQEIGSYSTGSSASRGLPPVT